jgi:hypothetical protein
MTLDEFFGELEKTPRDWFLFTKSEKKPLAIRRVPDDIMPGLQCPISCLRGMDADEVMVAGDQLRLSWRLRWAIADAADELPGHDADIRKRLLQACGLSA